MEASLTELGPGPRNQHVTALSRTEVCPPRDVSDRQSDVNVNGVCCVAHRVVLASDVAV